MDVLPLENNITRLVPEEGIDRVLPLENNIRRLVPEEGIDGYAVLSR